MIDSTNIFRHVANLCPLVTDSIWIGKLNNIRSRVKVETPEDQAAVLRIEQGQIDERIFEIFNSLEDNPLVKWKDSIKKVVGLQALIRLVWTCNTDFTRPSQSLPPSARRR